MSEVAICVERLGKRYRIGARQAQYRTLRESIVGLASRPLSWMTAASRGSKQHTAGDSIWALRDVSFEVKQGEVVGIIGRNGAGKSTLLKILSRITKPTEGTAHLTGRVGSLLEVGTGFHPELTGRENVYLNGAILGMRRAEIDRKFDEIVGFAEIERFLDTPVKHYSSGMYVRLAFAVAAHLQSEILLVDEVLAVGDYAFQAKCLGRMEGLAKGGHTVMLVSHNLGAISRLCDRSLLLESGTVRSEGSTQEVIRSYITSGREESGEYTHPPSSSKVISLKRVAITRRDGTPTAEVRYDEDFTVLVEYRITEHIRDCGVWIALQTLDGVMLFTTADYDADPNLLGRRSPGVYRATIPIPSRWLNYGRYSVIVGIVQNTPLVVHERVDALAFSILEIGSPSSLHEPNTRRGVLQPLIEWAMETLPGQ